MPHQVLFSRAPPGHRTPSRRNPGIFPTGHRRSGRPLAPCAPLPAGGRVRLPDHPARRRARLHVPVRDQPAPTPRPLAFGIGSVTAINRCPPSAAASALRHCRPNTGPRDAAAGVGEVAPRLPVRFPAGTLVRPPALGVARALGPAFARIAANRSSQQRSSSGSPSPRYDPPKRASPAHRYRGFGPTLLRPPPLPPHPPHGPAGGTQPSRRDEAGECPRRLRLERQADCGAYNDCNSGGPRRTGAPLGSVATTGGRSQPIDRRKMR